MTPDSTKLAVDRTRLAHDRTLMAWVRTATSLISFGFAIDKFGREIRFREHPAVLGARNFALAMIIIGLISLVLSVFQHRHDVKELEQNFGKQPFPIALIMAVLVGGLWILGLLTILTSS